MQTGAQLTAAFLLTLPFQARFPILNGFQRGWFLGLVVLAVLTTALVMAPVAIHRWLAGRHVKQRLVRVAGVLQSLALIAVGLLIVGIIAFLFDVVAGRTAAVTTGVVGLLIVAGLMLALPAYLMRGVDD